jgi:hypothetical protein
MPHLTPGIHLQEVVGALISRLREWKLNRNTVVWSFHLKQMFLSGGVQRLRLLAHLVSYAQVIGGSIF